MTEKERKRKPRPKTPCMVDRFPVGEVKKRVIMRVFFGWLDEEQTSFILLFFGQKGGVSKHIFVGAASLLPQ